MVISDSVALITAKYLNLDQGELIDCGLSTTFCFLNLLLAEVST